jgi:hypothetical protein
MNFNLQRDKVMHFFAGVVIGLLAIGAGDHFLPSTLVLPFAFFAALSAGLFKEYAWDAGWNWWARRHGKPEPHSVETADWVWTTIGGIVSAMVGLTFWMLV